jgi:hypothetical protein
MIKIAISQAAFDAIAATLPLGSVGYENEVNERGERLIWLDPAAVSRLRHARARRKSSAIRRWRRKVSSKGLADGLELSGIYESAFLQLVANQSARFRRSIQRERALRTLDINSMRPPQI